jgi:cystathionine beta-lyase family protein involved in aluminum resistance
MITQEDIDGMADTPDNFESVRRDVERALQNIRSAKHWLDETGDYNSERLNDAYDNIKIAERQISRVLGKVT